MIYKEIPEYTAQSVRVRVTLASAPYSTVWYSE